MMFGVMGGLGIGFNLFNVVAAILIIGLGVDYGILVVCRISEGSNHATEKAVLVSGLTTLAGFGALVMARHPALHSIGVTVILGIGAAIPSALFVIPGDSGISSRQDKSNPVWNSKQALPLQPGFHRFFGTFSRIPDTAGLCPGTYGADIG